MTTWIRLDGDFYTNPKLIVRSLEARWLWLASIGYCGRNETDGLIPRGALSSLAPELLEAGTLLDAAAELLADVGGLGVLWETDPLGYRVHGYLDKNPTREYLEQRRNAGRIGGRTRAATGSRSDSGTFSPAVEKPVDNLGSPHGNQASDQAPDQANDQRPNQHDLRTTISSSSTVSSSIVPADLETADISERQDRDRTAGLVDVGIDDDVGYLIGKIARHDPRILEVSPAHVLRLQRDYGVPVLRELFRRLADPLVLSGHVLSWPAYIDATARRVAEQEGASDG